MAKTLRATIATLVLLATAHFASADPAPYPAPQAFASLQDIRVELDDLDLLDAVSPNWTCCTVWDSELFGIHPTLPRSLLGSAPYYWEAVGILSPKSSITLTAHGIAHALGTADGNVELNESGDVLFDYAAASVAVMLQGYDEDRTDWIFSHDSQYASFDSTQVATPTYFDIRFEREFSATISNTTSHPMRTRLFLVASAGAFDYVQSSFNVPAPSTALLAVLSLPILLGFAHRRSAA